MRARFNQIEFLYENYHQRCLDLSNYGQDWWILYTIKVSGAIRWFWKAVSYDSFRNSPIGRRTMFAWIGQHTGAMWEQVRRVREVIIRTIRKVCHVGSLGIAGRWGNSGGQVIPRLAMTTVYLLLRAISAGFVPPFNWTCLSLQQTQVIAVRHARGCWP